MPFITITASQGLSADQKKQLIQRTSDIVVEKLSSSLASVRVMFHELPDGHYLNAGKFNTPTVMFEVHLIGGRTEEAKAGLIASLTKVANEATGVSEAEIRTRIVDFPNTDMGMAGGITAKQAGR